TVSPLLSFASVGRGSLTCSASLLMGVRFNRCTDLTEADLSSWALPCVLTQAQRAREHAIAEKNDFIAGLLAFLRSALLSDPGARRLPPSVAAPDPWPPLSSHRRLSPRRICRAPC